MVNNALGHRLGQIHSVESQRDDEDRVCLGSQWQPHGVYAPSTLRRGEASTARILRGKKVPTKTGGSTSRKLTKSSSHASMLPTANVATTCTSGGRGAATRGASAQLMATTMAATQGICAATATR